MSFIVVKNGTSYDMTPLVQNVKWSGKKSSAARSLEVNLIDNDGYGYDRPDIDVMKGVTCGFYWNDQELFRGIIMKVSQSNKRKATIKAYDSAIYLANNEDTFVYKKKTATQIFKDICTRFDLKCEAVDTSYVITNLTMPNVTCIDAIWSALAKTYRATSKRYFVISEKGVLKLIARADNMVQWVFEEGSNLLEFSRERDIEYTRTRVKLYSDANAVLAEAKDTSIEASIGIMQHAEQADSKEKKAKLQTMANELLAQLKQPSESFSIESLGVPDVITGKAVWINIPFLGLKQTYFVDEDTHTFEMENHTMSLTLNAVNEVEKADEKDDD